MRSARRRAVKAAQKTWGQAQDKAQRRARLAHEGSFREDGLKCVGLGAGTEERREGEEGESRVKTRSGRAERKIETRGKERKK